MALENLTKITSVGISSHIALTGVTTVGFITSADAWVGGALTVGGNITIGGTVTYEDVTNVDSVGIITSQNGLRVTAGGINVTAGVSTYSGLVDVNNRIDVVGGANIDQANITGILTATTLIGALTTTDACQTGDLTIVNGNPDLRLKDSNHAGNNTEHIIAFQDSSGNNQMNIGSPFGEQHLRIKHGTTELVKIQTNGRVGINTTSIDHVLQTQGSGNNGSVRIENSHTTVTVSGNTASTAFPHNLVLSNYQGSGNADNRMASIGFDIPTTSSHANATIAYQATDSSGNGDLQFWLEDDNTSKERLRIDSNGWQSGHTNYAGVGINTFASWARTGGAIRAEVGYNAVTLDYMYFGTGTTHPLALRTGNTTALLIDNNQKIGIGTDAPDTILHLSDSSSNTKKLLTFNCGDSKRNNYIGINGNDNLEIGVDEDEEGNGSSLRLRVDGSEVIRLEGGMTGIRQTDPKATLHVKAHDNNWEAGLLLEDNTGDDGWNLHPESSDASFLIGYNDNTTLALASQTATTVVKLHSGGNLEISNGDLKVASGHGIDFSATGDGSGSMTAELLNDYEEGNWTPTYDTSGATGTISGVSYATQVGKYVKIGKVVYVEGVLKTSAITKDANGTYDIGGLPYACVNSTAIGGVRCYLQHSWTNAPDSFDVVANTTRMRARQGIDVGDGTYTTGNTSDFNTGGGNNNRIYFSGSYRAQ